MAGFSPLTTSTRWLNAVKRGPVGPFAPTWRGPQLTGADWRPSTPASRATTLGLVPARRRPESALPSAKGIDRWKLSGDE